MTWAEAARPSTPMPWNPFSFSACDAAARIDALACFLWSFGYRIASPRPSFLDFRSTTFLAFRSMTS